jgi:hypothetical protein
MPSATGGLTLVSSHAVNFDYYRISDYKRSSFDSELKFRLGVEWYTNEMRDPEATPEKRDLYILRAEALIDEYGSEFPQWANYYSGLIQRFRNRIKLPKDVRQRPMAA